MKKEDIGTSVIVIAFVAGLALLASGLVGAIEGSPHEFPVNDLESYTDDCQAPGLIRK